MLELAVEVEVEAEAEVEVEVEVEEGIISPPFPSLGGKPLWDKTRVVRGRYERYREKSCFDNSLNFIQRANVPGSVFIRIPEVPLALCLKKREEKREKMGEDRRR